MRALPRCRPWTVGSELYVFACQSSLCSAKSLTLTDFRWWLAVVGFLAAARRHRGNAMARRLRVEFDGPLYHVTARGNERKPIGRDDADRSRWLEWLARVVGRHKLELFSFARLDSHCHLFLETPHGGLSLAMQSLNGSYTWYFNRRHRRVGRLCRGRAKAIVAEGAGG